MSELDTAQASDAVRADAGKLRSRLAHALVDLGRAPMATDGAEAVAELAVICQNAFSWPVAVSITFGDPAAPTLVATRSQLAQSIDGAQLVADEGPSHDSWRQGLIVTASRLPQDERWPRLASRLADSPVCAVLSMPVQDPAGSPVGTLNVYSVYSELVDAAAVESLELLAGSIGDILHRARERHGLEAAAAQLERALQSRATIDQAKGILMERHGCDADAAFRLMAETSSSTNVKLREVAERLVREAAEGGPAAG